MTSRPSFTNQQINSIVVNENEHNPFYVFCLMRTLLEELKSRAGGAATPIINKSTFSAIEIRVPPLPVQHRIASILSAYDDLIGNNTRRIAILEEMAQAIYREWFVNFGFPGHEDVEMVESELGEIPEGWEVGDLRAIAHLQRESVRPQAHPDEVFEYYSIPAFDAGRSPMLEPGNQIRSSKYLVPEGSILVSKLNPRIPRVWIFHGRSDHRAVGSTEFLPLVSRTKSHRSFLYALLNSTEWGERLAVRAGGTSTSHQRVKPGDFMRMPFPIPHQKLVKAYSDAVNPFFELIEILRRGSDTLRETRDLLLPRLVSGEINVNEFSEELEEAIA